MLRYIALMRAKQKSPLAFWKHVNVKPYLFQLNTDKSRFHTGIMKLCSAEKENTSALDDASLALSSSNDVNVLRKKTIKCSICGENGHNRRTCPKSRNDTLQAGLFDNLSDSAVDKLVDEYYSAWITKYRLLINQMSRDFIEEDSYREEADLRMIDMEVWQVFIGKFRRGFILDPIGYASSKREFLHFAKYLDDILQLKRAFPMTALMEDSEKHYNEKIQFAKNKIFELLLARAQLELKEVIHAESILRTATDLRNPSEWYPFTRLLKRKIIYHGGPTNSGKTYHALKRLAEADPAQGGGLYCGPLRLLALEIYENLNKKGIYTNLTTGQEKREVPGATHTSCTLEMVSLQKHYDVVVIDEIQMIADRERGYAWTWALLGLIANEVHLCGGMEAAHLVQKLVESTGDEFILQPYQRLAPLYVAQESLGGDYSKVRPGDCIVAFSRGDIFSIRRTIESLTPYKCAIIYGQLPPETRSTQARLFNEENTGYDILVASDAIGMGLNLNIRRIVFHTAVKGAFNNSDGPWVEATSIKQIAGRAGRLSSNYKFGEVTAWQEVDLAYIRAVMDAGDLPSIDAAGVFPTVGQIEAFTDYYKKSLTLKEDNSKQMINQTFKSAEEDGEISNEEETKEEFTLITASADSELEYPAAPAIGKVVPSKKKDSNHKDDEAQTYATAVLNNMQLSSVLDLFKKFSKIDGRYFLCDYSGAKLISNWLHSIPLSITDKFIFSTAPVNSVDNFSMNMLYEFASAYALGRPVGVSSISFHRRKPRNVDEFAELCYKHNAIELYLWLSFRFPKLFIEREQCLLLKTYALNLIEQTLSSSQLMHLVSHSTRYEKMRRKYPSSTLPNSNPIVLELTERYLSAVPPEKLYVIPPDDNDRGLRRGINRRSFREGIVYASEIGDEESGSFSSSRKPSFNERRNSGRVGGENYRVREQGKHSIDISDSDSVSEENDFVPEMKKGRSTERRDRKYGDRDSSAEQSNRFKDKKYLKDKAGNRDSVRSSEEDHFKRRSSKDRRDYQDNEGSSRRRQSDGGRDRYRHREGEGSSGDALERRQSSKGQRDRDRNRDSAYNDGARQGSRSSGMRRVGVDGKYKPANKEKTEGSRHNAESQVRLKDRKGSREKPQRKNRVRETGESIPEGDMSKVRCRFCKELGHVVINCPKKDRLAKAANISESSQISPITSIHEQRSEARS